MIALTPLRTRRITAQFQELTLGGSIYLTKLPIHQAEAGTTEFLMRTVDAQALAREGQVTDVRLWTVQERGWAMAHYFAHTTEGEPNFAIGSDTRLEHYVIEAADVPDLVDLGELEGDHFVMAPLLGIQAEAIERLLDTSDTLERCQLHWMLAAMAAQIRLAREECRSGWNDGQWDEFLPQRIEAFLRYPETVAAELFNRWYAGQNQLNHFLQLDFDDAGIAWRGKEGWASRLARFPVSDCISPSTRGLLGLLAGAA